MKSKTVRALLLFGLVFGPLAFGSRLPPAYLTLVAVSLLAGVLSWRRAEQARARGETVPSIPGARLLLALLALVAFQLVPLPPWLLRLLSPGSYAFYNEPLLLPPLRAWKPITAHAPDTLRGLLFLASCSLAYAAAVREGDHRWRVRVAWTVAGVGTFATLVGLAQQAYGVRAPYGLWHPDVDWAVFGPYSNRNDYSGYMLMAIGLALGLTLDALRRLRRAWRRRVRKRWLALGDREGLGVLWAAALVMVGVAGLVAVHSRGALAAFGVTVATLPLLTRRRLQVGALVVLLVALGVAWVGVGGSLEAFRARDIARSRTLLWEDGLEMVPSHLLFGAGFNAFGHSYPPRQKIWGDHWVDAVHNEYLQVLIDTGLTGGVIVAALLFILFRRAFGRARETALAMGLWAALLGVAFHNVVEHNWQLLSSATTFAVIAGFAVRERHRDDEGASSRYDGNAGIDRA